MDYNLKTKSPSVAINRAITPTSSPGPITPQRVGMPGTPIPQPMKPLIGSKIGASAANTTNTLTNATSAKKTSTDAEIKEKLAGYVQVEQAQWIRLPTGAHIRYFAKGEGSRNSRFRTGGFIVSWTKSANGKVYLKIANKLEFTNKQAGYRDFSVDTSNINEIWAKPEVVDKVKNEVTPTEQIKQLADEIAALKTRVAALERRK